MIKFWELYQNRDWVKPFLILSIYIFIVTSFILYLLIIRSRNKNIIKDRLRIEYNILIEKIMFTLVFQDVPFSSIKEEKDYAKVCETSFFREVLMDSIINLHKNYEGVYATKLEQFYKDSGLIKDSLKKLKSLKWEINCKGITELSELNVTESFDTIMKFSKAWNKTLKITALNACVKLAGVKGIVHLTEHRDPIDDWTQVNIIHAFKKHDIGDTKGVELLLESQNATVVMLGLKLIKELKLTQKIPFVKQLATTAPNTQIKYVAENVLQTLTV